MQLATNQVCSDMTHRMISISQSREIAAINHPHSGAASDWYAEHNPTLNLPDSGHYLLSISH